MSLVLKQTPLFSAHVGAGARMVDFGGWDMPVHYGSQIEEHHAVRRGAGMFDVSHMLNIDVQGAGALNFLRYLLANDVAKLTEPGRALYTCMLNPQGGVIDDFIVYFFATDDWRLVVNAGTADKDIAWMKRVCAAQAFDVSITPRSDLAMIAVQGPHAREKLWAARPDWQALTQGLVAFSAARISNALIARTGYTGEDGFEIVVPAEEVLELWQTLSAQGVQACGLGASDNLRLEAVMNLYGQDMDELVHPNQAGLSWTIALKDPDRQFIGRPALEHFADPRVFIGLKLCERGVMRAHMAVKTSQGVGEVTSGTMSPTLGVSIGFARLPLGVKPGDTVQIDIRGKWVDAIVSKLPFVRNGQAVAPAA
jgi:aminomethyltransferase